MKELVIENLGGENSGVACKSDGFGVEKLSFCFCGGMVFLLWMESEGIWNTEYGLIMDVISGVLL